MRSRSGNTQPAEKYAPVDHFPVVLEHFSEERLLEATRLYVQAVEEGRADGCTCERATMCCHECERRGMRFRLVGKVGQLCHFLNDGPVGNRGGGGSGKGK